MWIRVQNLFPGSDFSAFDGVCKLCWSPVVTYETETEKLQEVLHLFGGKPSPLLRQRKEEMFSTYTFSPSLNPINQILEGQGLSLLLTEMSATINDSNKETAGALLFGLPLLPRAHSLFLLQLHWLQWKMDQEKNGCVLMVFTLVKYGLLKRSRNFK